jgi:hypothetical protein
MTFQEMAANASTAALASGGDDRRLGRKKGWANPDSITCEHRLQNEWVDSFGMICAICFSQPALGNSAFCKVLTKFNFRIF